MRKRSSWILLPLLGLTLACSQEDAPAAPDAAMAEPGDAEAAAAELQPPRDPREFWSEALGKRDMIREILSRRDIWYEDLEELDRVVLELVALTEEVWAYVRLQEGWDERSKNAVGRTARDIRLALIPIRRAVAEAAPGDLLDSEIAIDDTLRLM